MSDIKTNHTTIGESTIIGKHPDGDRVLCMHNKFEQGEDGNQRCTFTKWCNWDGEKITEEYEVK